MGRRGKIKKKSRTSGRRPGGQAQTGKPADGSSAPSRTPIIDVPDGFEDELSDPVDSEAAQVDCELRVYSDRIEVSGLEEDSAAVQSRTGRLWNTAHVVSGETGRWIVSVAAPRSRRAILESAKGSLSKWFDRLGALALWLVFVTYMFHEPGVLGKALARIRVSPSWEGVVILVLVAALFFWGHVRGARILLVPVYVAFSPVIVAAVLLAKLTDAVRLIGRLNAAIGSLNVAVANVLLMIACVAAVSKSGHAGVLWPACVYLAIGMVYLIVANFVWVTSPMGTVFRIVQWADGKSRDEIARFGRELPVRFSDYRRAVEVNDAACTQRAERALVKLFGSVSFWSVGAEFLKRRLRYITSSAVLFYVFAFRFLLSLGLILLAFASLYLAIAKLDPTAFRGDGLVGLADGLYFSVGAFFTAAFGDIVPVSQEARGVVVAQVWTALVMLSLLALSFSSLSHKVASEATERVEKRASEVLDELAIYIGKHYRIEGRGGSVPSLIDKIKEDPGSRWR